MKLIRVGEPGAEVPGVLDASGVARSLSGVIDDISGATLKADGLRRLRAANLDLLPCLAPGRYGPPLTGVGKIVCVGLNYSDHAAESSMAIPSEPVLFFKSTTSICGPDDDVLLPPGSEKTDWEVELGVVIGETARTVSRSEALSHVAGYLIVNDLSERAFQLERGGQWVKGKSCDTFGPLGPWLVTRDEIPDVGTLRLWLRVNGHQYQNGSTERMIFDVPTLVSYISHFMTLMPGDIISTGTPAGVGLGLEPPRYLKSGDVMELGVQGLGTQRHRVTASAAVVTKLAS
ncbi:MAG TPA: fumarylacetoacetate hydrolase family protein [Steroidobacteraceae bacterium]|nr:fumarylacetoacetate hydrolase family protein [Steroidobacteraceae bacterium]